MGELRLLLKSQSKVSGTVELGAPSPAGILLETSGLGVASRRSFVDVLRSSPSIKARAADLTMCYSRFLDLFPVSSCFESEFDGLGLRSAVDCYTVEGLSTPLATAAESVSSRKKKGKIGISGVLWLLGQIQRKLDWVLDGFDLKPNRRRKRV